jgi:peptidoglycan/xylan/chitin deacetylase (PgdA/CDA1 family)
MECTTIKAMRHPTIAVVLTYHSLDESGSVLAIAPCIFAEQMRILHELGVRVVPLAEIHQILRVARAPQPIVVITFDDGFQSVYEHSLPVLERYGFPATVFLVTDYCEKTNSWPSQPRHIERQSLLRWSEIKDMNTAGITFGSHTRTHPDLRTLAARDAEEELVASKKAIEDATGRSVDTFAYPYGTYNEAVKRLVQAYFAVACSTTLGFVKQDSDLLALERLDMYYLRHPALFRWLFSRPMGTYIGLRRYLRELRRGVP